MDVKEIILLLSSFAFFPPTCQLRIHFCSPLTFIWALLMEEKFFIRISVESENCNNLGDTIISKVD